mmetsp:Transcript_10968/g.27686  ORF Transcript_10968/g.27686 Transcript_10968/m.27686 type:complete len:144 (-) Transcript_10968:580-1011(-)
MRVFPSLLTCCSTPRFTRLAVLRSSAARASSRIRRPGRLSNALAIATLCFWPPLRLFLYPLITLEYPFSSAMMSSWISQILQTLSTSSRVTSCLCRPYFRFSRTVPSIRGGSCGTRHTMRDRSSRWTELTSTPATFTAPSSGA